MFFLAFFTLLLLNGAFGVLVWLGWQKIASHLKDDPVAAKLFAEHVLAPLLMGKKPKDEPPPAPEKAPL